MGSVYGKPTSVRPMNKSRFYGNRQSESSYLLSPSAILSGVLLALAALSLAFLSTYTFPSLKIFLFEAIPSLWRYCACVLFTPTNLFVMLNLIILSIFGMARLHSGNPGAVSASSSLQLPSHGDCAQQTSEHGAVNRSLSEAYKLDDDQNFADLRLGNEAESDGEQISDQDDDQDNEADNAGLMVLKEEVPELQQAGVSGRHSADFQIDEQKADPESKKAEKAKVCAIHESAPPGSKKAAPALSSCLQGNPPLSASSHDHINFLLSEESSIFTLAQNRPLPSARFTHKRATKLSSQDRPLSPLKMSRPILKRGDTLDATWKAICESKRQSSPLNRHHSKHTRKVDSNEEVSEGILNKPKVSSLSPLSPLKQRSKINMNSLAKANHPLGRREPSLPQEELNAKVESFISRFNEQIRIQRKKSLLDYMEMVNRGST